MQELIERLLVAQRQRDRQLEEGLPCVMAQQPRFALRHDIGDMARESQRLLRNLLSKKRRTPHTSTRA